MEQILTKHKNRYKVFQVLPMNNVHPYFSLKNLGENVRIIHNRIWNCSHHAVHYISVTYFTAASLYLVPPHIRSGPHRRRSSLFKPALALGLKSL